MDDATTLGVELIPPDDDPIAPDDALAAASASAVGEPVPQQVDAGPEPFGMGWRFNFDVGRFEQQGGSPAETQGLDTLAQRCLMAIHTARFAHPVVSDEFGLERPDDLIGQIAVDELAGDYEQRIREALLALDGVSAVDVAADWDPVNGVLTLTQLDVTTDEGETLPLPGVALNPLTME